MIKTIKNKNLITIGKYSNYVGNVYNKFINYSITFNKYRSYNFNDLLTEKPIYNFAIIKCEITCKTGLVDIYLFT